MGAAIALRLVKTRTLLLSDVNRDRLNAATAQLIAEEVGYQTDTAFIRAFRREYGVPPATWRRRRAAPPVEAH